jgi:hypothetical protein
MPSRAATHDIEFGTASESAHESFSGGPCEVLQLPIPLRGLGIRLKRRGEGIGGALNQITLGQLQRTPCRLKVFDDIAFKNARGRRGSQRPSVPPRAFVAAGETPSSVRPAVRRSTAGKRRAGSVRSAVGRRRPDHRSSRRRGRCVGRMRRIRRIPIEVLGDPADSPVKNRFLPSLMCDGFGLFIKSRTVGLNRRTGKRRITMRRATKCRCPRIRTMGGVSRSKGSGSRRARGTESRKASIGGERRPCNV